MTRWLYRCLVWLHPPAFRREFAGEMIWIFEEAAGDGVTPLFTDGVLSLLRQWLLRTGPWKVVAALLGALLEVTAGGLGWLMFSRPQITAHLSSWQLNPPPTPAQAMAMNTMMYVSMWALTGVLLMVVFMVFWVKALNARRLCRLSAGHRAAVIARR